MIILHWGTWTWISRIEFKLLTSNWKRFDLYFPLLKPKNRARFLLPFRQTKWKYESMKPNLSQKALKLAYHIHTYIYIYIYIYRSSYIYIYTIFKVISKFEKKKINVPVLYPYLPVMIIWSCKVWNDFTIPKYLCIKSKIPTNLPIQVTKIL